MILWLTGQSRSGKTTLARRYQEDYPCIVLDGDEMRASISRQEGFSLSDRTAHNIRVAHLARELSKQTDVIVAVIAPTASIRKMIDKICRPTWVYIKRTIDLGREYIYEPPSDYPVIDHDLLTIDESYPLLLDILGKDKKVYSLFIGRWQPLHEGHLALFKTVQKEGRNIAIGIRDSELNADNPYTVNERRQMIKEKMPEARIFVMPDIDEVVYGRDVGWRIREIRLDKETESISATEIRRAG